MCVILLGYVQIWHFYRTLFRGLLFFRTQCIVALCRAQLVLEWATIRRCTILIFNPATQAISAWPSLCGQAQWVLVMAMATIREENGEFSITVAAVTRTAGILTLVTYGAGCWELAFRQCGVIC